MLKNFWYAIEFGNRVTARPQRATVLGLRLALYRTPAGTPVALADRCAHRDASLCAGTLKGDCLVCPYHGWEYAPDGQCVRIPANPPGREIPRKARVDAYPVQERHGFVWVFVGDVPQAERPPLPAMPELDELQDRGGRWRALTGDFLWQANYERVLENSFDIAHGPFVHGGSFGDPQRPEVPDYEVQRPDPWSGFATVDLRPPPPKGIWGLLRRARTGAKEPLPVRTTVGWILPNIATLRLSTPFGELVSYASNIPIDATTTLTKFVSLRTFFTGRWADRDARARIMKTYRQDRDVLEQVHPQLTPADASAALSVRSDLLGVAYRRRRQELAEQGWLLAPGTDSSTRSGSRDLADPGRPGSGCPE